ncbi:MAG: class I SAM-dependent methyltransferase [Gemmatimonadetes bacterium]|nr:class I SAM-dependent methyltransferase [Gemmatimonadota bacterium]
MDAGYGARYAELYHRHWWWRAREAYLIHTLDRRFAPGAAGDILDFGCGDGLFFPALAKYGEPYGIEPEAALLDPAGPWRARISTDLLTVDPREAHRYGLIVALDVLEHLDDPASALHELVRRLKPGGTFIATVPAFQSLWTAHDDLNHHVRRYRRPELESLVTSAGLEVVRARYFFVWLALLKWLVVRKERLLGAKPRPPGIPWAPVNAIVQGVCRAEQFILADADPAFGSSLIVIAHKPG